MDPLLPARMQFAANVSFHILFPAITIALGWFLLYFRVQSNRTGNPMWESLYLFWTKIFALCFGLGVVSGITMSFQFGTNWPGYMRTVGNVAGPLLGYEVLSAFFLEATFLGVMLYGRKRVSARVHTTATFLVAVGTSLSAFWILALNSWMHTPAGFVMRDGKAFPTDWLAVVFNPSMPYRTVHMMLASGLTASFLIAGISAYRMLKGDRAPAAGAGLRTALKAAAVLIPLQVIVGDMHGLNTLQYQPAKIAAIEGVWETERGVPLQLFAIPNEVERRNDYSVAIPKLGSIILTHDIDGEIVGLNQFTDHPPVKPLFFGFRIMVGIGVLMLITAWAGVWLQRGGRMLSRPFLYLVAAGTFTGWAATLAGWYVTEIGRQPWLVTGILRTADAVGHVTGEQIWLSLGMYLLLYAVLLIAFMRTVFYLAKKEVTTHV